MSAKCIFEEENFLLKRAFSKYILKKTNKRQCGCRRRMVPVADGTHSQTASYQLCHHSVPLHNCALFTAHCTLHTSLHCTMLQSLRVHSVPLHNCAVFTAHCTALWCASELYGYIAHRFKIAHYQKLVHKQLFSYNGLIRRENQSRYFGSNLFWPEAYSGDVAAKTLLWINSSKVKRGKIQVLVKCSGVKYRFK